MPTLTRPYLNRINIGWTTRYFFLFFAQDTYFFCLFFFLSMKITDKHESHGFYDVSRYPPSQPRPHCAFPWLLDKLRWTKVIVTDVSHFFGPKIRLGFWEPNSTTPPRIFRSTPRKTWSLVASLPVSISAVNSPGLSGRLQIRDWNLPDNRQSLPFLVDSTVWQWNFKSFALFELFY